MRKFVAATAFAALCVVATPGMAGDEEICLDCHEPSEDWVGISQEEAFRLSRAPRNKRHEDNESLSDEELMAIIARLLPTPAE